MTDSLKKQIVQIIGLASAMAFMLSGVLAGAFSWSNYTEHKTNDAYGMPIIASVVLEKQEKTADGAPTGKFVAGAEFYLYKVAELEDLQIGGPYLTDVNGQISLQGLSNGLYYFLETAPSANYALDRDEEDQPITRYNFETSGQEPQNSITVTAYNRRIAGSLIISKEVKNANGSALTAEQIDANFEFIITFSDNGVYTYTVDNGAENEIASGGTIWLKHGQSAIFNHIPPRIGYIIEEADYTEQGYTATVQSYQGVIVAEDAQISLPFVNVYDENPEEKDGSLLFSKTVTGEGIDYNAEFDFIVTLAGMPDIPLTILINGEARELQKLLPDEMLEEILEEILDDILDETSEETLNDNPDDIPDEQADDIPEGMPDKLADEPADGSTDVWPDVWPDVSNEILDELEDVWPNVSLDVSDDGLSTVWPDTSIDISSNMWPGVLDDESPNVWPNVSQNVWPAASPVVSPDVSNEDLPEEPAEDPTGESSDNPAEEQAEEQTEEQPEELPEEQLEEQLEDQLEDQPEELPEEQPEDLPIITYRYAVVLKHGDTAIIPHIPHGAAYTIIEQEKAGYTASTIIASGIIAGDETASITFINHQTSKDIPPITADSVSIEKIIRGAAPSAAARFQFTLTAQANAPMPENSPAGVKQITINGEGAGSFGNITYNEAGTYVYAIAEINSGQTGYTYDSAVYTLTIVVEEQQGALQIRSRTLTKHGETAEKAVFINRYHTPDKPDKEDDIIVIRGEKTWNHGGNDPQNYPQAITVLVKANGVAVAQSTVTANDGWRWSFTMDKYDAQGKLIHYTVDEDIIPGYSKSISGYNITNTYDDPTEPTEEPEQEEKIEINGSKTWDHGNLDPQHHPASITVLLKVGELIAAQSAVSAEDNWSWSFIVNKYDADGNEIFYTIDEENIPGYTKQIVGCNIHNTYNPKDPSGPIPQTGDDSNIWLWAVALKFSIFAMMLIAAAKRKNKHRQPLAACQAVELEGFDRIRVLESSAWMKMLGGFDRMRVLESSAWMKMLEG